MALPGARGSRSSHLHPVVLVIHVLQPGNELSRVETVSDRFVFVSLRTGQQKEGHKGLVLYLKHLQVPQAVSKPLLGCTLLKTAVPAGRVDGAHCCQLLLQPFPGIQPQVGMHPCAHTPCFSLLCRESVHASPSQHLHLSDSFTSRQDRSSTDTRLGNADRSITAPGSILSSLINPRILSLPRIPPAMQQCNDSPVVLPQKKTPQSAVKETFPVCT